MEMIFMKAAPGSAVSELKTLIEGITATTNVVRIVPGAAMVAITTLDGDQLAEDLFDFGFEQEDILQ